MCQVAQQDYTKTLFLLSYLIKYIKAALLVDDIGYVDAQHVSQQIMHVDTRLRVIYREIVSQRSNGEQYLLWREGFLRKLARIIHSYCALLDTLIEGESSLARHLFSSTGSESTEMTKRIEHIRQLYHTHLKSLKKLNAQQKNSEAGGAISDAEYQYLLRGEESSD